MLNRKIRVSIPVFLAAFGLILAGQFRLLSSLAGLSWGEYLLLAWCVALQSVAAVCLLTLLAGGFSKQWSSALAWVAVFALSTIPLWDNFSYRWLGLHVHHTVPFLYWSTITTFRAIHSKRMIVFSGLGLMTLGAAVFTVAVARLHRTRLSRSTQVSPFIYGLMAALIALAASERCLPWVLTAKHQEARARGLPLLPLLIPNRPALRYSDKIFSAALPGEELSRRALEGISPPKGKRLPDIYLFILESLRVDHIVPEVAPNLSRFRAEALPIPGGIAGGNCTHISWYSILHGRLPLYWSSIAHQAQHRTQSVPIVALKKLGYRMAVIATPSLNYYSIGETLFGPNRGLASRVTDQSIQLREGKNTIAELDRGTMDHLKASLDADNGPTLTMVFLDSTHHDYGWHKSFRPPFEPFLGNLPVTKMNISAVEMPLLRNRYKNAVAYVDSLMGEFLDKRRQLNRPSIVAVTGDHGEELKEEGHLTHSSALNRHQLEVPLLISIPGRRPVSVDLPASHVDIFPTLLDAVGIYDPVAPLLDGRSLLRPAPDATAVAAQCSNYVPFQYLIDAGEHKAVVEFDFISKLRLEVYGRGLSVRHHLDGAYRDYLPTVPFGRSLEAGIARVAAGYTISRD